MSIEHVENTGQYNNEFPFAYLPSKEMDDKTGEVIGDSVLGRGWESITKRLGPGWVIKEANPFTSSGEERSEEMMSYLRSKDRVKSIMRDQNRMEDIFGSDNFAKTYFVYGKNLNGKEGYIAVQELVPGEVLSNLIGTEYLNTKDMVLQNREQFKKIVWGMKKAVIEFGAPVDFHPGNIIKNENNGTLVIIDTGIPSDDYTFIKNSDSKRNINAMENAYERLNRIKRYEEYLELTESEIDELNKKYGVTNTDYESRIKEIDRIRTERGIEIEIDKDPVDKLLDSIFGDREEITGQDIYDYAKVILGDKEPTKGQKVVLDKIEKLSNTSGNRSYWKDIINL